MIYIAYVLIGVLAGGLSGFLGIGGGIVMVPLLVLAMGCNQHLAQGTALAVMVPTALVGAYTYGREGNLDAKIAILVCVGSLAAAWAGAYHAQDVPAPLLRRIFGAVLVLAGLRILIF